MKPHDNSARFYDCIYEKRFGARLNQLTETNLQQIQQLIPRGGKIVDFGAGTGRLSIPLAKLGYEVQAIDISQKMLDVLVEKANKEKLNIQTFNGIRHTDWSKDMVVAVFTVLAYILDEENMSIFLKLMYDSLKPGGYFMFDLVKKVPYETSCRINNCVVIDKNIDNYSDFVKVELFNNNGNTFAHYSEKVDIICNNERFEGGEDFDIRFWNIQQLENLPEFYGFTKIKQFDLAGADYFIYQKNKLL